MIWLIKNMRTLHKLVLISISLILTHPIHAAFLRNVPQKVIQPDGTIFNCFASGDEFHNWLHDKDGFTIIQDPVTGYYVYAKKINQNLHPTPYIAGKANPTVMLVEHGVNTGRQTIRERRQNYIETLRLNDSYMAPTHGTLNNIVIFIRFNDQGEFTEPLSFYDGQFNTDTNSMKGYYQEASYQTLSIESQFFPESLSDQLVSYQDAHPRSYYRPYNVVTNPNGYQNDEESRIREHTLLKNALNSVAHQIPANLDLDLDNDGLVDNVCFIIQGEAEGWSDLLWPHMWVLWSFDPHYGDGTGNVMINGSIVWTYNFNLSAFSSSGPGVLCHEMFHSLGAPDLYHYTNNGISPVGPWDLMENDQDPPQHMSSYMKYRYGGWIDNIPEITADGVYNLSPLTSATGNCYRIASPNSGSEYFVVEYRKKEGTFESSLPGSGLLVYRINTAEDGDGNADGPPDEVYIYRPGGTPTQNGNIYNANFSSTVGRTQINDITDPSPFLSDGSPGGLTISNIGSAGSTIQFTLGGSYPSISTGGEPFSQTLSIDEADSQVLTITNTGDPGSLLTYTISFQSPPPGNNLSKAMGIGGSTFEGTPSLYRPGTTFDIVFTITNSSTDEEWLDGSSLNVPSGVTVNSSTHFVGGSGGNLETNNNTGEGVTVTWSDVNGGFGNVLEGESAVATVNMTVSGGLSGDINLDWTLSGDNYGSTPHNVSGSVTLTHSWLIPSSGSGMCVYGETDDISLNFNATGFTAGSYNGTVIITHNSGDPVNIPISLTVTDNTVKPPPSLISLQSVNDTNLQLTFSEVEGATAYNIYRSTTASFIPDIMDGSNRVATGITDEDPISDGVQWTDHENVVGDPSTNYFYTLTTVGSSESDPSEKFGEFDFDLITTGTTDFNEIALPLITSEITNAQHLMEAITGCNSTAQWNSGIQGYEQYIPGIPPTNFTVEMGYPYYVNVTGNTGFTLLGKIATPSFNLITTPTTDFNEIVLPLTKTEITKASQLMNDIPNCNSAAYWDASIQGYQQYIPGIPPTDFDVRVGYPYYVNVTAQVSWPQGGTLKYRNRPISPVQDGAGIRAPHCAWGRFDLNVNFNIEDVHFSAFITSRTPEKLTEQSPGCSIPGGYWIVQCSSFPSPWKAGDTLHVDVLDKTGRILSEVEVELSYEPADEAESVLVNPSPLSPNSFELQQNMPNPFNSSTTLFFTTIEECHVRIIVYNMKGQEVRSLLDEIKTGGYHSVVWNGRDNNQHAVDSGVYFIQMEAALYSENIKVLLLQ